MPVFKVKRTFKVFGKLFYFLSLLLICINCFALEEPDITPTDEFFVYSEQGTPVIPSDWRLKVEGDVNMPLSLSLDDIKGYTSETKMVTLECVWNYILPQFGWIGNANWTGVPLSTIIDASDPINASYTFKFYCLDGYTVHQDLPEDEILLAYEMNGEKLPDDQGYPIRVVVPGYTGNRWAQWLEKIEITSDTPTESIPVIPVHAQIFSPENNDALDSGPIIVSGAAYVGSGLEVEKVEVSTDGGQSWNEATLLSEFVPNVWKRWEYIWANQGMVSHTIYARATDSLGYLQEQNTDLYGWRFSAINVRKGCFAESLLGEKNPKLSVLRDFRDRVLSKSIYGKAIIDYYYDHSEGLIKLFDGSPVFRFLTRNLMETVCSVLNRLI